MFYRTPSTPFAFATALGVDRWERKLTSFQTETWRVIYLRAGAEYNTAAPKGFFGAAGIKYPIDTREDARAQELGFAANPKLKPGRAPSFYASAGYRFTPRWDVVAYYDSFRFKTSQVEDVGGGFGIFQPRSHLDMIGVKVHHTF